MSLSGDRAKRRERLDRLRASIQSHGPDPTHIVPTLDTLPTPTPVVIIARVSSPQQKSHLPAQIINTLSHTSQHTVLGIHSFIKPATDPTYIQDLITLRHTYPTPYFVAEHLDRFIRSPDFGKHNPYAEPSPEQLTEFHTQCQQNHLIPITIYPATLSLQELGRMRSKRGQLLRSKTQQEYKRKRRDLLLPLVQLLVQQGQTPPQIAASLALAPSTVRYYLSREAPRSVYAL